MLRCRLAFADGDVPLDIEAVAGAEGSEERFEMTNLPSRPAWSISNRSSLPSAARDRLNIERHIAVCEASRQRSMASSISGLAAMLASLARRPSAPPGQRALQFFIADGKYRVQAFALEDLCDGKVTVYLTGCPGCSYYGGYSQAPSQDRRRYTLYEVADSSGTFLALEKLNSANTVEAPDYYRQHARLESARPCA